jgi:uncharacterized protein (DUF1330 family)
MAAYIIVDIDVTDPALYEEYKTLAPPTVAQYGGKYIVRGGAVETLEGDWQPKRLVILEFESVAQAKAWWASEEYRIPKSMRQRASLSTMLVVQGA